ncbi:MAG: preprotein translocase subunit SecE [Lachnospiraceae bacterium]|nr:preprotein translocase subunit SecE [Candidatus Equihabitans merdae]
MADNSVKEKKDKKTSFWQGVKQEWRKIMWADRKTLVKQTILVLLVSIVLGALIAVIDNAALYLINLII